MAKKNQNCPGCGKTKAEHVLGFEKCTNALKALLQGVTDELLLAEIERRAKGVKCPSCHQIMERHERAGHRIWYVCTNLYCEKNQKQPKKIGRTRVL